MSEHEPLLPSHNAYEPQDDGEGSNKGVSRRERAGEYLESRPLHQTVIALVLIDSACVLADLSYTFLNETCTPDEEHQPIWLTVLAHVSLAITAFFLIEIPINIWAFGWSFYQPGGRQLHSSLHFFDAIVIITTFIFEVVLRGRERKLASLLIILRLWRLVKLVQGIAVSAGELEEANARKLEETRQELDGMIIALADAHEENRMLRERIVTLESSE